MILVCLLIGAAYFFYKWATANNDYFEKKDIAFSKPVFLLGANSNMFINKRSLPEAVETWYNEFKNEK